MDCAGSASLGANSNSAHRGQGQQFFVAEGIIMERNFRGQVAFKGRLLIGLSAICLSASVASLRTAEADVLHASTAVWPDGVPSGGAPENSDAGLNAAHSEATFIDWDRGIANVGLLQNGLLGMGASAYSSYTGEATALSSWTDTIFITGGDLPPSISMNFAVDAVMQLFVTGGIEVSTVAYHFQSENNSGSAGAAAGAEFSPVIVLHADGDWSTAGFTSIPEPPFPVVTTLFSGVVNQTVLLNKVSDALYSTNFSVSLEAYAGTESGSAFTDALHTLTILSVTNLDGTPLTGDTITFDSGMQLPQTSETPEPSTLVLSSILFGVFGTACVRKRMKRTATAT